MWGVNRLAYGFGYWGYDNPYYTETYPLDGGAVIDYSEPLPVDTAAPASTDAPVAGIADFDAARQAFYQGDYAAALTATNKALSALPNDPIIHEFRALVLFAQGKYHDAAAGLYSVLAVGPGWDWTTLSSLYPNNDVYAKQFRALEAYLAQHPQESDARFVLAYHCITTGNKGTAAAHLKILRKSMPDDKVITELLLMIAGPEAVETTPTPAATTAPAPVTVPSVELFGAWNAVGEGQTKFELQLTQEGTFTWTYTQKGKAETVKGLFGLDENVLALQPETGGTMLAEITKPKGGKFDFQLLGAPPGDPGLKFTKIR
jgi:tetratricopeptide (TPR) repeat protein